MRYIIIGAGAIGGTIGGRLYENGFEVVLVARGAHAAALRTGGLRFATPEGVRALPIPTVTSPGEIGLRPDDVLVLAVKTQHTEGVLAEWAPRPVATDEGDPAGGRTAAELLPVVCAQNGVENERIALRRFRHVYGMYVWMPTSHLEPGRVSASGAPLSGVLRLGRYPCGSDDNARRIAADLEKSVFAAPVSEDVMRWKYGKLLGNVGNALEAVAGPVTGEERTALYRRARQEYEAVLEAAGIPYATVEEQTADRGDRVELQPVAGEGRVGGSSAQSLIRGSGSIETDYLNGEVVLLGRLHGVPTPVNEALQRLADEFARTGRPPGSLSAEELAALG
ncbi:ketopantoate reductase family protein [Saccharothrix sp. ST-888]|uniref:ketopantoate reductase family protein n=1 Tax=Saccharothrix sp. ST-888 TaxID=1427391 RepID=UPI0005ECEAD2|nr:2-dehydropantoate 2-reductase N-terminal domain-containing protein [Saccharothrix sp. ST-888]KJK58238.1 2-dehydropantoate 2-reductase [Saccharothrix sp. ST-888]